MYRGAAVHSRLLRVIEAMVPIFGASNFILGASNFGASSSLVMTWKQFSYDMPLVWLRQLSFLVDTHKINWLSSASCST